MQAILNHPHWLGHAIRSATHICRPHYPTYLLHGVEIGTQPSMHCEYLFVNDSCYWQAIEAIGERFPQLDVVPPFTLIIKPIYSIDGCAFMVPSEDEKVLRIFDLVCKEQADGFERLLASIYVVPKKKIIGLGRESSVFKQT